jgi:hypothetical protein
MSSWKNAGLKTASALKSAAAAAAADIRNKADIAADVMKDKIDQARANINAKAGENSNSPPGSLPGSNRPPLIFGARLNPNSCEVPIILQKGKDYYDTHGVELEGLFRISANHQHVKDFKEAFERGKRLLFIPLLLSSSDPSSVPLLLPLTLFLLLLASLLPFTLHPLHPRFSNFFPFIQILSFTPSRR